MATAAENRLNIRSNERVLFAVRSAAVSERPIWLAAAYLLGHVFACLLWSILIRELMKRAGMLNVIKASLLGSALMLLEGCANLQSYQTPCVQGHVCECVQYTTVNRSWVDCRSYGRVSLPRPLTR